MTPTVVMMLMAAHGGPTQNADPADWTIYVTNDNCPDYTWGFTEEQTRQAFADIVRAHLDEMTRSDGELPENQSRYNMAVTQEALCFVERYPERQEELIRRIREGRLYVSPYLCNSLWAFQSLESALRTLYPARRLEREWGLPPTTVAEHIEEPSLPWGVASILAGCGIRWLSNSFYAYDSTFGELTNPPLFTFEGPDGAQIRVVMDPWACNRTSYMQGGRLLREPQRIAEEWLPHYVGLGAEYPLRAVLASGTHGDINPTSGQQAREFAEAIIRYNASDGAHAGLVNAALPQFCAAVDAADATRPFLQTVRGCFGHAWDVWPVSLAKYVAAMRDGERRLLSAEALLAVAGNGDGVIEERRRAEWLLAMLSDHAWNGTGDDNKRHNADLRKGWSEELNRRGDELRRRGWDGLGARTDARTLTVFNSLSIPCRQLVYIGPPDGGEYVLTDGTAVMPCQALGDGRELFAVSPEVPGFGLREFRLQPAEGQPDPSPVSASPTHLESPFYRIGIEPAAGGITSFVHKASGRELLVSKAGPLCATVYSDGEERRLRDVSSAVAGAGPVCAAVRMAGEVAGIHVVTDCTVYADLDRVYFRVHIDKPVTTREERLCHVFPVVREGMVVRIETTGAVIRPYPQPRGDLLPGADTRRFAVQGFVDASLPGGPGVTVAPLEAFVLRMDLGPLTFEALGNDQNHREVIQDQHGQTSFSFGYGLRAHEGDYDGAQAFAWSRSAATPLLGVAGSLPQDRLGQPPVEVDPSRAIATCLKPADEPGRGVILRLWETRGEAGPLPIRVRGYRRALKPDLLERDLEELPVTGGVVTIDLGAHGFATVRLLP